MTNRPPTMQARLSTKAPQLVTFLGLVAGLGVLARHLRITDFPVDMVVYRHGVEAFFSGGDVYSQPFAISPDLKLPFIYPPFGALALSPIAAFSAISDALAGDVMVALSAMVLLACLVVVLRAATGLDKQYVWALAALGWPVALLSDPLWLNAGFAQVNVLIMGLIVFDLVPRRRRLPQGWLIGIAAAIKISPLAMLLVFLVRREWKPIVTAAASAVIATVLAALVRWETTVQFFGSKLAGIGGVDEGAGIGVSTSYTSNSSLKAFLQRFASSIDVELHPPLWLTITWILLVLATIAGGALLIAALHKRHLSTEAWLVNALVMLLISPISWSHHWVWIALIIPVFAWRCWSGEWTSKLLGWTLAIWTVLAVVCPPKWWFGDGQGAAEISWWQNFIVSDFMWCAGATLLGVALSLKNARPPAQVMERQHDCGSDRK